MPLFWAALWSSLPALALLSGLDRCTVNESSRSYEVLPLLKSIQCYNNFKSHVHCKWRPHSNTPLWLWVENDFERGWCEPYGPQGQDQRGTAQCRFESKIFSIGVNHNVLFLKNKTQPVCPTVPHKLRDTSLHLRARPPANLSTHDAGDGGRWLHWFSPYPSSSPLNKNLTYQLSYKTHKQDLWITKDVTNTSIKLEKQLLLPGHRYEARVRARAHLGQWSDWSPVVMWRTEDTGPVPSVHCVLEGEKEVKCSWEVKRAHATFTTYQLCCQHNQAAQSETCCKNLTVSLVPSGTWLRYSCSLTVADPAHLLLELKPAYNARTFKAFQHIQLDPPEQVTVREENYNWIVEWHVASTQPQLTLYFEVCYYMTQDQGCTILNISGSMCNKDTAPMQCSLTLQGASLAPSQQYRVKVRSLFEPGQGEEYEGIPSEWTDPVEWTSHTASLTTLVYVLSTVFVATVFFTLYCTIPTCQRRVILWVGSVPSPGKSKILSEIKSATSWALMQSEDTSICKVLHFNTPPTCSSDASLWSETNIKCLEPDKGYWHIDNLPITAEKVSSSDTSSMSFSGPYILCQTSESSCKLVDVKCEEKEREEKTLSDDSPPPVNFALYGEGYVCLPNHAVSRSTQDLVSHSDASTNTHRHDGAEQGQQCPDTTPGPDKTEVQPDLGEATSRDQPPAYTSTPFISWPQGGTIHSSGYCHFAQPQ